MNVKLLRKVTRHVSAEPRRLVMDNWIEKKVAGTGEFFDGDAPLVGLTKFARCGTAACIAGWATLLRDKGTQMEAERSVSDIAQALLEIDSSQADRLFNVSGWPERFESAYRAAKSLKAKAKVAVSRIEHFIKTKGAE